LLAWLPLVIANLRRRPMRLVLTLASVIVAFTMFALLEALRSGFATSVDMVGTSRLMTLNKVSIIQPMPVAYVERVRGVVGVEEVASFSWFGGVFRDGKTQIPVFPTEPKRFLAMYPEIDLSTEQRLQWIADRQGALIGEGIAKRYGLKVGDKLPLRSAIYRKADGGDTWQFVVRGIYGLSQAGAGIDTASVFFHYDYFNESIRRGRDQVGWLVVKVADPANSLGVSRRVDELFRNSSAETKTSTEKAMAKQFADQVGSIGTILISVVTAVFFTMLLVTANTMAQAIRERTSEIGVLKTLGFSARQVLGLVLAESVTLAMVGGLLGLGIGHLAVEGMGPAVRQFIPVFELTSRIVLMAIALMLFTGVISGLWPAMSAMRLKITDALRRT
jgi:putative ABC transport system permease protein